MYDTNLSTTRIDLDKYGETDSPYFDKNQARFVWWGHPVSQATQQVLTLPAFGNSECVAQWNETLGFDPTGYIT